MILNFYLVIYFFKKYLNEFFSFFYFSAYGSLLINKSKYTKVVHCDERKLLRHLNDPFFKKMQQLSPDFYEVELDQKKIRMDTPTQLGAQVLSCAKRVMLMFVYEYIDRLVSRKCLRILATDTDSIIVSLSASTIDEIIKPESRGWFHRQLYGNHETPQHEICPLRNVGFFPRRCCKQHSDLDERTPLFFKVEYVGDSFCGLCSKTYCIKSEDSIKFSCKGLQKSKMNDVWCRYLSVLTGGRTRDGVDNVSFRIFNNQVYTYKQSRQGLTSIYMKAITLDDGVSTRPLNLR